MFQSGQPPPMATESRARIVPNTAFLVLFLWIIFAIFLKEKARNNHTFRTQQVIVPSATSSIQLNELAAPPE